MADTVADLVGRELVGTHGVDHVFGVVGSGNFHVTNAMVAAGARYVAAVHEGGAASMADGFARVSGRLTALSVHQGPGVTNALTGVTEAAKSRTPLVVLAPEATAPRSNFFIDLPGLAASIGAAYARVRAEHAVADIAAAVTTATAGAGRTVLLGLPLDVQAQQAVESPPPAAAGSRDAPAPDVTALVDALRAARRPVFIAGRGATRSGGPAVSQLAERCGALLAVSAAAKGLFAGDPWYLDISGGFATPLTADLIGRADLVVAWGSTLNMWTTRHGRLIPDAAVVAQIDLVAEQLGANHRVDVGVAGDVATVAAACAASLAADAVASTGFRTPEVRARIEAEGRWALVPYMDEGADGLIDPRTLSIGLDDLLPAERTVVIDSGNFMGYPSTLLSVPDAAGFVFTQAYQSIGLGLGSALGAAIARPDRLTVAALGDGGYLMGAAELATAATLGVPLLIVVYNDAAYGAEVHHFGPDGHVLDTVRFPDRDLAAIGRGYGLDGVTVRSSADLAAVREWVDGPRERPLVVDAKVVSQHGSWWLEEAFRGH
jgi:thiamine pyrophosphate-dependent acetolactate synthase large subunit-like protein